jgi:hypothetical protein
MGVSESGGGGGISGVQSADMREMKRRCKRKMVLLVFATNIMRVGATVHSQCALFPLLMTSTLDLLCFPAPQVAYGQRADGAYPPGDRQAQTTRQPVSAVSACVPLCPSVAVPFMYAVLPPLCTGSFLSTSSPASCLRSPSSSIGMEAHRRREAAVSLIILQLVTRAAIISSAPCPPIATSARYPSHTVLGSTASKVGKVGKGGGGGGERTDSASIPSHPASATAASHSALGPVVGYRPAPCTGSRAISAPGPAGHCGGRRHQATAAKFCTRITSQKSQNSSSL